MRKLGGSDDILTYLRKEALIGRGGPGGLGGVLPLFGKGKAPNPLSKSPMSLGATGTMSSARGGLKMPNIPKAKSKMQAPTSATPTAPQPQNTGA